MSLRRMFASLLLMLSAVSIGGSNVVAQSTRSTPSTTARTAATAAATTSMTSAAGLLVPVTGVADLGGLFGGALLIQRFAPQANGIVVSGMVTGTLTVNGTVRNLVIAVTLPLDTNASRARVNTDPALAQSSCDVLHVELGGTSLNVLGSTMALNPVSFDIASTIQSSSPPPTTSTSDQPGTVSTTPSTNTTQQPAASTPTPGATTAAPTTSTSGAATQTPLGSLLCSVDRFSDVSNPSQVAQRLNEILIALSGTTGS